jgi:hypothetical protein
MVDERAIIAAQNNADWYAMMWDIRGLRYKRSSNGFRAIDPPPPYHSWAVLAAPDAPVDALIAPCLHEPRFGIKDSFGRHDLSAFGLKELFSATWIWCDPNVRSDTQQWEQITSPAALSSWEAAWRENSPSDQRQFPEAILDRDDVGIWGRRKGRNYDAGFIANMSNDCVGLSNIFGKDARPAATTLCATFGQGKPVVGYEQGADLAEALTQGWTATGPLKVWVKRRATD